MYRIGWSIILALCLCCCDVKPHDGLQSPFVNVAFVVTSDYSTGSFSTIDIDSLYAYKDLGPGLIHSDTHARYYDGKVYIVNKKGRDNVQVLDSAYNFQTIGEFSTGQDSNPHDIIVVSSQKAYVSLYGKSGLLIINPETGAKLGEIDLAVYAAQSQGVPRMSSLYLYNDRLFVALQRLGDDWTPVDYSSVVMIDISTDTVMREIKLQWRDSNGAIVSATNPYSPFRLATKSMWQPSPADNHDHLLVSCTGDFGHMYKEDGGIVAIDLEDLHCENGFIVAESVIHAEITNFVIGSSGAGYLVTLHEDFSSRLLKFDLGAGTLLKTLHHNSDSTGSLWSLALHGSGKLFVCDRNVTKPGVRVYGTFEDDLPLNNSKPIDVGLPPSEILFIE